jgi:hypothetical protein
VTASCPPWLSGKTEAEQITLIVRALTAGRRAPGVPFLTPHSAVWHLTGVVGRAVAERDAEIARLREALAVSA